MLKLLPQSNRTPGGDDASQEGSCPLGQCTAGTRALVVCVSCPSHDARRLRMLGVYEGASIDVVDVRNGILLDVRGSRLAIDGALAMTITVVPGTL